MLSVSLALLRQSHLINGELYLSRSLSANRCYHKPLLVSCSSAVSESVMEKARSDPEAARQLLLFHGTQGRILSNGISDGQV